MNDLFECESLNNSINTLFPEVSTNIKDRVLYAAFSLENSQKRANDLNNKTTKILQDQFVLPAEQEFKTIINNIKF